MVADTTIVDSDFAPLIAKYPSAAPELLAAEDAAKKAIAAAAQAAANAAARAAAAAAQTPVATGIVGEPVWFVGGKTPFVYTAVDGSQHAYGFQFDFGDSGAPYNRIVGWSAAHVYNKTGDYLTSEGLVRIAADPRLVVTIPPTDYLCDAISKIDKPTLVKLSAGKTYGTRNTIRSSVSGITIDGNGAKLVKHAGNAYAMDSTVAVRNLSFTSDWPASDPKAIKGPASAYHVLAGHPATVIGCMFLGESLDGLPVLYDAINCDNGADRTFVQDCACGVVSGHFLWCAGTNVCLLGGTCAGSTQEMPVRQSDPDGRNLTLSGGLYAGISNHPDAGKESVAIRMGQNVVLDGVRFEDAEGFAGWLQFGEGNQPSPQRTTTNVLVRNCQFTGGPAAAWIQINACVGDVAITGCEWKKPTLALVNIRTTAPAGAEPIYYSNNIFAPTPGHYAFSNLGGAKVIGK